MDTAEVPSRCPTAGRAVPVAPRSADACRHARLGRYGEDVAARHLTRRGMAILDRNVRASAGEIDIVALDDGVLVICEVKTRASVRNGLPAEAVTPAKVARLRRLAAMWLATRRSIGRRPLRADGVRIDVVQVLVLPGRPVMLRHLRGVC